MTRESKRRDAQPRARAVLTAASLVVMACVAVMPAAAAIAPGGECLSKTAAAQWAHEALGGRGDAIVAARLGFPAGCSPPTFTDMPGPTTVERSAAPTVGAAAASAIYVDGSSGSDSGDGSAAHPFATLGRAQQALRGLSATARAGASVMVREGTYYEPLLFTDADGGGAGAPVTWQAAPTKAGASVVLSGGMRLPCAASDWRAAGAPFPAGVLSCSKLPATSPSGGPLTFAELFVDGIRAVRARTPNGDPLGVKSGYTKCAKVTAHIGGDATPIPANVTVLGADGKTTIATLPLGAAAGKSVRVSDTAAPRTVSNCKMDQGLFRGTRFNESGGRFPFWNTAVPSAMTLPAPASGDAPWPADPSGAVIQMMHPSGWGSWAFQVGNGSASALAFAKGAFQEARGGGGCGDFYMENSAALLDAPGEWFHDAAAHTLYYYPRNGSTGAGAPPSIVEVPLTSRVVQFRGSVDAPAAHITLRGFNITHAAPTYLDSYEVPSGGDWSLHRGAAVFLDGAVDVTLEALRFDQVGGNGVMLSDYVRNSTVTGCDFWQTGDSAILAVGTSQLANGSAPTYPAFNTVTSNWIATVGVYMKQTSCAFKAVSYANTWTNNVCHDGPRAGFNFNDGFMGADTMRGNVIFNMVRSTGDHGTFNSWDRREWVFPCPADRTGGSGSGGLCFTPRTMHVTQNFFIGPAGWNMDHDDGSSQYADSRNLVWQGGFKYRDGVNRNMTGNVMVGSAPWFQVTGFPTDYFDDNLMVPVATGPAPKPVCGPRTLGGLSGQVYVATTNSTEAASPARPVRGSPARLQEGGGNKCDDGTSATMSWDDLLKRVQAIVFPHQPRWLRV